MKEGRDNSNDKARWRGNHTWRGGRSSRVNAKGNGAGCVNAWTTHRKRHEQVNTSGVDRTKSRCVCLVLLCLPPRPPPRSLISPHLSSPLWLYCPMPILFFLPFLNTLTTEFLCLSCWFTPFCLSPYFLLSRTLPLLLTVITLLFWTLFTVIYFACHCLPHATSNPLVRLLQNIQFRNSKQNVSKYNRQFVHALKYNFHVSADVPGQHGADNAASNVVEQRQHPCKHISHSPNEPCDNPVWKNRMFVAWEKIYASTNVFAHR